MSRWGRAQDALHDILWGHEDGSGKWYPGPLYNQMEAREFGELQDRIIKALFNIAEPSGTATAAMNGRVEDGEQGEAARDRAE